ncbi:RagB/SusD family nutrient uptake outer membrane protein [Sabulilitoribacter arenilitoris]|uniref:RagB/SusD family nutrient uptake outer membrane protein n=1 Tax=Wocania arenilitoris TaxID=2044858 RepID=A0AAE3JKH2_9FLAO|nr:RagB/SusD family nutrient uptake outer membrane protein [Wocania arenilitoris]MCF7567189.1 RagB/SusD family nutrient uptake outer membrane protein [Wocania arenilitoris]
MKYIKYYLFSLGILSVLSCDNELEIAPVSNLSTSSFYQKESDFEQALIGAYSGLKNTYNDVFVFGDVRSDNTIPNESGSVTTLQDFDKFNLNPSNALLESNWNRTYNTINRINLILDRIDDAEIDNSIASRIKGEAQFLRGLNYFNHVRNFGNVPLILNPITANEALEFPQSNPTEVYAQIVSDLKSAANLLPESFSGNDVGRATSIAANALLGKVYLTIGNYVEAESSLRSVLALEGSKVDLLANYADVFDQANEYNAEIIFAVRYANDGLNGNGFNYGFANPLEPNNRATGTDLFDEYEPGDVRRDFTLNTGVAPGEILIYKYGNPGTSGRGESDWPIIRFSDVLLMLSEALNEQSYVADGEAFTLLNRIRNRAGLGPITSTEAPNQETFRLAMEHERRVEFAGEAHRWYDLVRTDRFEDLLGSLGAKSTSNLFPIPLAEIQKINDESILRQNPGY